MTTSTLNGKKFFHTSEPDFIYAFSGDDGTFVNVEFIEEGVKESIPFKVETVNNYIATELWVIVEDEPQLVCDL